MNVIKLMSIIMLGMLVLSPMIIAQKDTGITQEPIEAVQKVELVESGIGPDSIFYGLDRAIERLSLAFTSNKEKRAEKALMHAEERLAEVRDMIEKKKFDKAEIAERHHKESIERAEKAIEEIESDGKESVAKESLKKVTRMQNKIESHHDKIIRIKGRILERQRDRMTEEQIAHLEEVFSKIEEESSEVEAEIVLKKERAKTKYKVLSEKTDDEIEFEIEEIEESEGLTEARKIREEVKEMVKQRVKDRKENYEDRIDDGGLIAKEPSETKGPNDDNDLIAREASEKLTENPPKGEDQGISKSGNSGQGNSGADFGQSE